MNISIVNTASVEIILDKIDVYLRAYVSDIEIHISKSINRIRTQAERECMCRYVRLHVAISNSLFVYVGSVCTMHINALSNATNLLNE